MTVAEGRVRKLKESVSSPLGEKDAISGCLMMTVSLLDSVRFSAGSDIVTNSAVVKERALYEQSSILLHHPLVFTKIFPLLPPQKLYLLWNKHATDCAVRQPLQEQQVLL